MGAHNTHETFAHSDLTVTGSKFIKDLRRLGYAGRGDVVLGRGPQVAPTQTKA